MNEKSLVFPSSKTGYKTKALFGFFFFIAYHLKYHTSFGTHFSISHHLIFFLLFVESIPEQHVRHSCWLTPLTPFPPKTRDFNPSIPFFFPSTPNTHNNNHFGSKLEAPRKFTNPQQPIRCPNHWFFFFYGFEMIKAKRKEKKEQCSVDKRK